MAVPLRCTLPALGVSSPASRPSSVDLPLPVAPMMATNWPLGIVKSSPFRMSTVRGPLRIDLRRPSTAIMGVLVSLHVVSLWQRVVSLW